MYRTLQYFLILAVPVAALFVGCSGEPGAREFRNGIRELEQGRHVRAMALLEKSVSRRPASGENAAAHNYIGVAAWRLGRVQRAIEAFENSRRQDPNLFEPVYNLAVLYHGGGDMEKAAPLFEEAARMAPQDSRPLEFLGHIHLKAGRLPESRRAFFGALARAPQSARVLTSMALVDRAAGDPGKAVFYLMQALERNAAYAPALYNLAVIYRDDLKDEAQASATFERYVETEPDEARRLEASAALQKLSGELPVAAEPVVQEEVAPVIEPPSTHEPVPAAQPRKAEDLLKAAREEARKRNAPAAVALCLEAAEQAAREENPKLQEQALRLAVELGFDQAQAHLALGRFLSSRGDRTAAVRSLKQAALLDPQLVEAHEALAEEAVKAGEYDTAVVTMKQVVQLAPERADGWWSLALLYDERLGIPARALEGYREFVKRFPGDPRVVRAQNRIDELAPPARGETASRQPAPPVSAPAADSAATLPRVVVTQPSGERRLNIRRPVVRNAQAAVQAYNRGTLYQQGEDWDRAIFFYTRALENDDTFTTAYFNLAAAYWAKGDHVLAKDAYRLAIELQPEAAAARFNLALLHRELRERDKAIEQLEALLKTTPDHAQAHYVLGLLYAEAPANVEKAGQHYRKFLELAPNDPAAGVVREWLRGR